MRIKKNKLKAMGKTIALTTMLACSAQGTEPPQKKKDFAHDFTVGLESQHYQYSEASSESKHLMHDKGVMGGVHAAYQLTYKDVVFLRPEARWAYGYTKYWSEDGGETKSYNAPSRIIEARLLSGIPIKALEKLTLCPYGGLGYRHKWDNDAGTKTTTGHVGYKRKNDLLYLPVGLRFRYDLTEKWNLQGMAEFDWLLSGRQHSYEKRISIYPVIHKQTQGKGVKGEFLVGRQFEKIAVSAGIYAHYWKIKQSAIKVCSYEVRPGRWIPIPNFREPKNVTTEIGFKFNVHF